MSLNTPKSILGSTIRRLMQTPPRRAGVIFEEFGESYWIDLVAKLEDGRAIQIKEYDWTVFGGRFDHLISAQLVQNEFSLSDIEGQRIQALRDSEGEFALVLENGLCLQCLGGPGGNYPWIYTGDVNDKNA